MNEYSKETTATHDWLEIRLLAPREHSELCLQILLDAGCDGAQVDDTEVLLDESEDATLAVRPQAIVTGYFGADADESALRSEIEAALGEAEITAQITTETLRGQDWENNWKEHFPPLHIGPFLIAPTWHNEAAGDAILIRLDPGLAFGTGQHPTTRLCLELLAQELNGKPDTRVLDVGCGSGILGIAAAKLGATVTGSDLDPFCTEATRENAKLNNVEIAVIQEAGLDWMKDKFPLVVANLMSALLIQLAPQLAEATQDGGTLIVSGISSQRADDVEQALQEAGFETLEKRELDGDTRGDFQERWSAFRFKKL